MGLACRKIKTTENTTEMCVLHILPLWILSCPLL